MIPAYPCPACGHLVFDQPPGSHLICPVCFWEDDAVQLRWPTLTTGANKVSLAEAQRNVIAFGACDERAREFARPATVEEPVDPTWRPIAPTDDFEHFATANSVVWPKDRTVLYWWTPTFWRARGITTRGNSVPNLSGNRHFSEPRWLSVGAGRLSGGEDGSGCGRE
ncbi:CPCC family cysteine-rich protein [Nocardia sp. NPDC056100]|uniref:CPCC family cysteine-rich protein n=1 Tax=Nocardia sp. NPDC056100 TaxID=3345712 RepID=UPI0035DF9F46